MVVQLPRLPQYGMVSQFTLESDCDAQNYYLQGRVAASQALRGTGGGGCGISYSPVEQQHPYIHSEVLLHGETQAADSVRLKFVMCARD